MLIQRALTQFRIAAGQLVPVDLVLIRNERQANLAGRAGSGGGQDVAVLRMGYLHRAQ